MTAKKKGKEKKEVDIKNLSKKDELKEKDLDKVAGGVSSYSWGAKQ